MGFDDIDKHTSLLSNCFSLYYDKQYKLLNHNKSYDKKFYNIIKISTFVINSKL
jgi:hypothetical protein